jgi:hypothetical protein
MDDDERALLRLMLDEASHFTGSGGDDDSDELGEFVRKKDPREILKAHPEFLPDRAEFLLEKWDKENIYGYGVTNDLGWFYKADAQSALSMSTVT